MFWNLLSNAVKFTPSGGRIGVSLGMAYNQVEIRVSDSGEGISGELLPHVFDRFKQAEPQKGRVATGLGLGLALVREIVEAHGGSVVAQSGGPGRGSTFTVRLPVAVPGTTEPSARKEGAAVGTGTESLSNMEILIVDDDREARALMTALLESRGAAVRAAASAKQALEIIRALRPDILLSDIRMPEEDGYSLIQTLRAREREAHIPHLPAIAVTTDAGAGARELALAAGFDGHVPKPVDADALIQAILRALRPETV